MKTGCLVFFKENKKNKYGIVVDVQENVLGGTSLVSFKKDGESFFFIQDEPKRSLVLVTSTESGMYSWFDQKNISVVE